MPHPAFRRVVGPDPNNGIRGDKVRPERFNELQRALENTPTVDEFAARALPATGGAVSKMVRYGADGPIWDYSNILFADDYGLTDATTDADRKAALIAAIAAAYALNKALYISDGSYGLGSNPNVSFSDDVEIIGAGKGRTTFTFTSGTCFVHGDGAGETVFGGLSHLLIKGPGSGTAGTVGVHYRESRFTSNAELAIDDCETGVLCDGEDTWTDGNAWHQPTFNRNKYGFRFTADSSFQSNNNHIWGGHVLGNSPKASGGIGIWYELGQGNCAHGTDIEAYETGVQHDSPNPGGNYTDMVRIEDCTTPQAFDFGVAGGMIVGDLHRYAGGNGVLAQYGARLQVPLEPSLPSPSSEYRGVVVRRHQGGSVGDTLQIGMQRGGGDIKFAHIPTVDRELPDYLSNVGMHPANITDVTALASGDVHLVYVGKAPVTGVTTITLYCNVTTGAGTITWAEVAIYRGDSPTTVRRVGYANVAATFNSTGRKSTAITVADVMSGDPLFVAYGSSATTPFQLRACLADDVESGVFVPTNTRPSTTGNFVTPGNPWDLSGVKPAWVTVKL